MPPLGQTGRWIIITLHFLTINFNDHDGDKNHSKLQNNIMFSTCPLFACCQTCEHE